MFFQAIYILALALGVADAANLPVPSSRLARRFHMTRWTGDKGTIQVYDATGSSIGCALSTGAVAQPQNCAYFRPVPGNDGTVVFKSRRGLCAIDGNGILSCDVDVSIGAEFTNSSTGTGDVLAYNGNPMFFADLSPAANKTQSPVYTSSNNTQAVRLVYVALESTA